MNQIILRNIQFENSIVHFLFEAEGKVAELLQTDDLWIDYGQSMEEVPYSMMVIPFISIMLPLAWVTNATIWVKEIDRTFYYSTFNLRRAYSDLYPNYPLRGKIVPAYIIDNDMANTGNDYMLFSGGIDAHTSYIRNLRSIKALVNIQGWYCSVSERDSVAEADFRDIAQFSKEQNKSFYGIRSNFARIVSVDKYRYYEKQIGDSLWHGFQHSMAFISITIPLVFFNHGGNILIASSFTMGDKRVCASYPTTDNEFRYARNGCVVHEDFELTRQDKIKIIVDYQKAIGKPYPLRVCSFNDHNCCKCEKCFRSILGLIAEGAKIEDFGFYIDKPILEFYQDYFKNNMALFGVYNESISHWPHIKRRMRENYGNLSEYKDFVDWFLTFDFAKRKKEAVRKYYMVNFFSILKRKLGKL